MKKTLIVLMGALVLLAIVLMMDRQRDSTRLGDRFLFDTTQKDGIASIRIVMLKDTAVLQKVGAKWVSLPDSFPLDTTKIRKGLSYLIGFQSKEMLSTNPSRLVEYGLDSNQAKHIEWIGSGGKKIQVVVGKTSGTDYGSTYWKWEDKPEVYSTPGSFTWELSARSSDWKDRNLFTLDTKEIKSLQVDWRDTADKPFHFKLEAVKDSNLNMTEPEAASVKKVDVNNLISQIAQFTIDDFVTPNDTDAAKARLDTPMVSIKIGLKNGKFYEIHGGRTTNGMTYSQHPFRKDMIKIAEWRFKTFEKQPYELMSDSVQAKAAMPVQPKKTAVKKHR